MTPIQNLKVGEVAQVKVRTAPYLVLEQSNTGTTFLTPDFEFITLESGYAIRKASSVQKMLNTKSGITHLTINGKPVCGNQSTQDQIISDTGIVTCEKCKGFVHV